ncbi:MAG: DUF2845 domain-containing protein [Desulfobacteraceae bacterium]|nr:DUF2845 domain-containing protein [Desulfobacteraceae bacterium]
MKKAVLTIVLFFALAFCAHADSLRSADGNSLIIDGDSVMKVVQGLGEPAYKTEKYEITRDRDGTITKTLVERWYYSIDGMSYIVVIRDGRVIKIESLGRE